MSAYLDELYFEWLYGQICVKKNRNPAASYWKLFEVLYKKQFVWIIANDDNRADDGKDLRYECLQANNLEPDDVDQDWLKLDCSFLELLIGMSRRLAFLTGSEPVEWFWEMLENLDLRKYNDMVHMPLRQVENILDQVIWRTYRRNGSGGLFPLNRPREDQRDVELWYQLNAYIEERAY